MEVIKRQKRLLISLKVGVENLTRATAPPRQGFFHTKNPVTAVFFSSPAPHQNIETASPLLLLVVTTTAEILKQSRGQHPKTFHSHTQ